MKHAYWLLLCVVLLPSSVLAQGGESDLRIFGYFQTLFRHESESGLNKKRNSFSLQQLNLLLRKDLARNWRAFVNIEGVNTFNSKRNWGSLRFEEAWARYRKDVKLNLKIGLQIPAFNNFNEIKNRTPLLPYAIRPLVYETSFEEFITVEEYLPTRAFIQVYGFFPFDEFKIDYAVYLGNSPNINDQRVNGQTGADTTTSKLIGGRLGMRFLGLKVGLSSTWQNVDVFEEGATLYGGVLAQYDDIAQSRVGVDLSLDLWKLYWESEFISVSYEEVTDLSNVDKDFYYVTLGYNITERAFVYGGYWRTRENFRVRTLGIIIQGLGFSYAINDRINLKAQFARVEIEESLLQNTALELHPLVESNVNFFAGALSVFF